MLPLVEIPFSSIYYLSSLKSLTPLISRCLNPFAKLLQKFPVVRKVLKGFLYTFGIIVSFLFN